MMNAETQTAAVEGRLPLRFQERRRLPLLEPVAVAVVVVVPCAAATTVISLAVAAMRQEVAPKAPMDSDGKVVARVATLVVMVDMGVVVLARAPLQLWLSTWKACIRH